MKRITIGGKEYTIKFSVAASLYSDCTKTILDGFVNAGKVEASKDVNYALDELLSTMSNLPQKTLTLFYAGLLEYHGRRGDKAVMSMDDAEDLIANYLFESEGNKSFSDVFSELMETMVEDNFFDLIGLNKMITETTEPKKRGRKKSEVGKNTSTNNESIT